LACGLESIIISIAAGPAIPIRSDRTDMTNIDRTRPLQLIINPHCGYGGTKRLIGELRTALRRAGWSFCEHTTRGPEDASRFAADVAGDAGAVVVWGGDGTISEVASALVGTDVPILLCPAGTENLLGKELRIPLHIGRLVEALHSGEIIECDVGHINDRNFLLIIGVGFDGEVVRRVTASRTGHISHLSYFWPIWRTFWEHDFPRMRITADGKEIFNDVGLAFIGNISRYAVGLRICRDARFDDGLLDLVVFRCRRQQTLMLHAAWTLLRQHPLKGDVIYHRFHRVHIETDPPVSTQVDGDLGPTTPIDVSVVPKRIKLLIPASRRGLGLWPWRGSVPL